MMPSSSIDAFRLEDPTACSTTDAGLPSAPAKCATEVSTLITKSSRAIAAAYKSERSF